MMFIFAIGFYLIICYLLVLVGFEYVPNQKNNMMLMVDNHAFNKCKAKPTDDGNVSYRCIHYQKKGVKCHSSCIIKILPNGEELMIRAPKAHINHEKYSDAKKCYKKAISQIKEKCREPNFDKVQPLRIFNKIIEAQMKECEVTLTNEAAKSMPSYKNYKKQLYKSIEKQKKAPESTDDIVFDDKIYVMVKQVVVKGIMMISMMMMKRILIMKRLTITRRCILVIMIWSRW